MKIGSLDLGIYTSIIGILPWPIVFLTTDIINEFFGIKVVRFVSILTAVMISYCFVIVSVSMLPHAFTGLPVGSIAGVANDVQFNAVFGQSKWIIVGSITAFIVSQFIDASVFRYFKNKTGEKYIWLRSTGSTVVSQLIDTFVVLYVAFVIPGIFRWNSFGLLRSLIMF